MKKETQLELDEKAKRILAQVYAILIDLAEDKEAAEAAEEAGVCRSRTSLSCRHGKRDYQASTAAAAAAAAAETGRK